MVFATPLLTLKAFHSQGDYFWSVQPFEGKHKQKAGPYAKGQAVTYIYESKYLSRSVKDNANSFAEQVLMLPRISNP